MLVKVLMLAPIGSGLIGVHHKEGSLAPRRRALRERFDSRTPPSRRVVVSQMAQGPQGEAPKQQKKWQLYLTVWASIYSTCLAVILH